MSQFSALPPVARLAIVALGAVQIALAIYALYDLHRRRVVAEAPRWLWLLVILLGQIPGSIVYLAFGRKVQEVVEPPPRTEDSREQPHKPAVDVLYGKDKRG